LSSYKSKEDIKIPSLHDYSKLALPKTQPKSTDVEEDIVANAETMLIQELQLLNVEPSSKEYDLIYIYDLYS